jgi:uncharacterized OB-fold protein
MTTSHRYLISGPEGLFLRGQRCAECGYVMFPPRGMCPSCFRADRLEEHAFGRWGRVRASTVVHVGQPGFPERYVVAFITTDEGPVVYSVLVGAPIEARLPKGTLVELTKTGPESGYPELEWAYRVVRK